MELLLPDHRDSVGESPLWSPAEAALYWVDIEGRALNRWRSADGSHQRWSTDERLACIALHADGGLIAGMDSGLFHLRPADDGGLASRSIAEVQHPQPGMRMNDGRCDRQGRFWTGSMLRDMAQAAPAGRLFRCDAGGLSAPLAGGLITPNGLAFSPGGGTLYLSDSHPAVQQIWRFDLHDDGSLGPRQPFVDMRALPGRPDGARWMPTAATGSAATTPARCTASGRTAAWTAR